MWHQQGLWGPAELPLKSSAEKQSAHVCEETIQHRERSKGKKGEDKHWAYSSESDKPHIQKIQNTKQKYAALNKIEFTI